MIDEDADFSHWLSIGVDRGWVSLPVCAMHDGLPMTSDELLDLEDDGDPCVSALRLWFPGVAE